jgi:hypothetical protein
LTAQIRDIIDYEGRRMGVGCDITIRKHPRIRYVEEGERDHFLTDSSACWRGYIASWMIKDGELYLTDLKGCVELIGDEPLPATWVSEKIRLTGGEAVEYVHMGYSSTFELKLNSMARINFKNPRF